MTDARLPPAFTALEPWAGRWCLATEPERWAERLRSSMEELRAFYDAVFPRAEEAIAYCDRFPLDDGYRVRKHLYNLYHILNHLNMFGGGYLSQSQSMLDSLLSELH